MIPPADPIRKKGLSPLSVSIIVFIALSCLGIAGSLVSLKVADSTIDHSEKLLLTSLDYDELTSLNKLSFGPDAIACKWELRRKDNRQHMILSILAPSPTDFYYTISGYVIVTEDGTKNLLSGYDWQTVTPDNSADASDAGAGSIRKDQLEMINSMELKDRTLLYSEAFGNKVMQESTYAGIILFDAEHNMFYFHLRSSDWREVRVPYLKGK